MKYAFYGEYGSIILPFDYDEQFPDLVFSFGGDGTMLGSIHKYKNQLETVKFVGINTGKLGFYTDFIIEDLNEICEMIKNENYDIFSVNLMEYSLFNGTKEISGIAVNDLVLINPVNTQITEIYINDKHFETIRGTGILLSPPGGSTAYNKSVGGSIIDPDLQALQLVEVAPISNRIYRSLSSPMVLSKKVKIELKPLITKNLYLTVDGEHIDIQDVESISVKLSEKKVNFVVKKNTCFFDRVKRSFVN